MRPDVPKEVRAGVSLSLSGAFRLQGEQALNGLRLWVEYVRVEGGLPLGPAGSRLPLRLLALDDRSQARLAKENVLRLLTHDQVDLLIGPYSSGLTLAVAPLAARSSGGVSRTASSRSAWSRCASSEGRGGARIRLREDHIIWLGVSAIVESQAYPERSGASRTGGPTAPRRPTPLAVRSVGACPTAFAPLGQRSARPRIAARASGGRAPLRLGPYEGPAWTAFPQTCSQIP